MNRATNGTSEYILPERLRFLRMNRQITQSDLAKKARLSQSTVAQIENGKKDPSINTLKLIAKALDIEIAALFASSDVYVFDMKRLKKRHRSVDDLSPSLYTALGKVLRFAKDIGFVE